MSQEISGHTKGPWKVTNAIIGIDEPVIHPSLVVAPPAGSVDPICSFDWMSNRPVAEQQANARLIAAAPALLAALRELTIAAEASGWDVDADNAPILNAARAAIAKARGQ